MGRAQRRQHEPAADHVQDTFRARSPVYWYLVVGQKVDNKGVMMLRCTFCNKVFQGTQFQATRHFTQTNYCKDVSDEALYEIARHTQQKFEADQMERVAWYAAERGLDVPDMGGARGGEAGWHPVEGGVGGDGGHDTPDPPLGGGGSETEEAVIHIDREARGPCKEGVPEHEDVPEFYPGTGERLGDWRRRAGKGAATEGSSKRKEGGSDPAATPTGKKLRQQKVTDVYGGEWVACHKKAFLCWLYSNGVSFNAFRNQAWKAYQQVLLEQRGSSPRAVLPNHCQIASMRAVETHRAELAEELEEVRQPFWVTGATLLLDGRKSRDGRPIVNFLAAGAQGVVVYTTINREDERDARGDEGIHCTTGGGPGGEGDAGGRGGLLGPIWGARFHGRPRGAGDNSHSDEAGVVHAATSCSESCTTIAHLATSAGHGNGGQGEVGVLFASARTSPQRRGSPPVEVTITFPGDIAGGGGTVGNSGGAGGISGGGGRDARSLGGRDSSSSSSSSAGGEGSSSAGGGGTNGRRSNNSGGAGCSSRRSSWRSSSSGGGGGSNSGGGGGTVGSCSGGGVPGPVEEEIAAQAEVQLGGNDERLMQQFHMEELDPVIAGMTPGVARGVGIFDSEMETHLDFDLSMGLPPRCDGATSTDRAPSRDEAAGQTLTQAVRERTTTESPDAARDIMERERARLLASSNLRAQAFARALEEARLRETGGDCVQGGMVAGEDVTEGVTAEAVDEAMPGGAEAVEVAVEGRP
ncbi:hypothetical protein CBR_g84856 [Chara braunii]|uniref:BED-type domain-containing protein n=1 Tax=Chara braunii TaxID=69332 RepID=A0A388KAV5_CHABU|nr:hypothetical protein CBR_g84856 [Chara braunii]|eukprot:GBG67192.1 hypothetical protein CBR_g84856 [Chara braunii]